MKLAYHTFSHTHASDVLVNCRSKNAIHAHTPKQTCTQNEDAVAAATHTQSFRHIYIQIHALFDFLCSHILHLYLSSARRNPIDENIMVSLRHFRNLWLQILAISTASGKTFAANDRSIERRIRQNCLAFLPSLFSSPNFLWSIGLVSCDAFQNLATKTISNQLHSNVGLIKR